MQCVETIICLPFYSLIIRVLTGILEFSPYDQLFSFSFHPPSRAAPWNNQSVLTQNSMKKIFSFVAMLLQPGNVRHNPGLDFNCMGNYLRQCEFKSGSGFGIIHLNVRSLQYFLNWILLKSGHNHHSNIFHSDSLRKGGGVTIYIRNQFHTMILASLSQQIKGSL